MKIPELCSKNCVGFYSESGELVDVRYCISFRNGRDAEEEETSVMYVGFGQHTTVYDSLKYTLDDFCDIELRKWWLEALKESQYASLVSDVDPVNPIVKLNKDDDFKTDIIRVSLIRFMWEYPRLIYEIYELVENYMIPIDTAIVVAHILGEYDGALHTFVPRYYSARNLAGHLKGICEKLDYFDYTGNDVRETFYRTNE